MDALMPSVNDNVEEPPYVSKIAGRERVLTEETRFALASGSRSHCICAEYIIIGALVPVVRTSIYG